MARTFIDPNSPRPSWAPPSREELQAEASAKEQIAAKLAAEAASRKAARHKAQDAYDASQRNKQINAIWAALLPRIEALIAGKAPKAKP